MKGVRKFIGRVLVEGTFFVCQEDVGREA